MTMRAKFSCIIGVVLAAAAANAAAVDTRLLDAAKRADTASVRTLLQQRVDVNAATPDGTTALALAAYSDDLAAATLLIRAGAKVDAVNRYGMTPLMLACTNGNAAMIELLLKAKADANTALPEGETALMTAARTGKVDAVKALLVHGADVNAREKWRGQTALMWAAAEGHVATVEALLAAGADRNARSNSGFTPFLLAVREGQAPVVTALLKAGADVNEKFKAGEGGARMRSSSGVFPAPASGVSALVLAVTNAHYELAAMLIDRGADPNSAEAGWTALHTISWVRKPGGGNNSPAPRGSGAMDSLALVRKLKASGANFNARMTTRKRVGDSVLNTSGATAFLLASKTADAELMRLLAELGADPLVPNNDNSTPLMIAAGLGTRSPGEDAGTEPEVLEAVKVALDLGNNIDAVDNNGETAMHGAAYKQLPLVVQYRSERGAKIGIWNTKNKSGWTPLRIAAGVFRTANFRFSDPTAAMLRKIMTAAGVSTDLESGSEVQTAEELTRDRLNRVPAPRQQ